MDKYEETLQKAKRLYDGLDGYSSNRKVLEEIFPELRESEDEIHRKWILEYPYDGLQKADEQFKDHFKAAIAYLEKQKESAWTDEDESFVKHILPRILNPDKWTMDQVEGDRERLKEFIDRQKCKWLEKQKENPKSADSIPADCVSDAKCENRWHKVCYSLPDNGRLVLAQDNLGNMLLARYDGEGNWEVSVYDNED